MPEGDPKRATDEQKSAMEAYARSVERSIRKQREFNAEMGKFAKVLGPTGVSRGLTQFTRGAGDAVTRLASLKGATTGQTVALQGLTNAVTATVGAMTAFLDVMDRIERKQGDLQRTYGLVNVSMQQYYTEFGHAADIGGKAGVAAAEANIKAMLSQRRINMENAEEFRKTTDLFVKYTLAISQNFPKDFVKMQQELGMNVEDAGDAYKTLAFNASQARVPFEQYKDSVLSVTSQFTKLGVEIDDVTGFFNIFMDDVSQGRITMKEAQDAASSLMDVALKGGNIQQRAIMARFLSEEYQNLPPEVTAALERESMAGAGKTFEDLSELERTAVITRIAQTQPEVMAKFLPAIRAGIEKRTGGTQLEREAQALIATQMLTPFEAPALGRLAGGVETGRPETITDWTQAMREGGPAQRKAMEEFNKRIDENAELFKEFYSFLTKWFYTAKGTLGELEGGWKYAATGAMGVGGLFAGLLTGGGIGGDGGGGGMGPIANLAMLKYLGVGKVAGRLGLGTATTGAGLATGTSTIGAMGMGGMASIGAIAATVAAVLAVVGVGYWVNKAVSEAGGWKQLGKDIKYAVTEPFAGPKFEVTGATAGEYAPGLMRGALTEALIPGITPESRKGFLESAEKMYKTGGLKGTPEGDVLFEVVQKLKTKPSVVSEFEGMKAADIETIIKQVLSGKDPELIKKKAPEEVVKIVLDASDKFKAEIKEETIEATRRRWKLETQNAPRSS